MVVIYILPDVLACCLKCFTQHTLILPKYIAPTGPPGGILAEATSTSLSLTWRPPLFEETNGLIQQYVLVITEQETETETMETLPTNRAILEDLHPYYMYTIRVAAETVGLGPFSNNFTIRLPEDGKTACTTSMFNICIPVLLSAPNTAPSDLSGFIINSSAVSLSWEMLPKENQNGIIRYYSVDVFAQETGISLEFTSTTEDIIVYPLHPYYHYTFLVAGNTTKIGPFSEPLFFKMPEDSELRLLLLYHIRAFWLLLS